MGPFAACGIDMKGYRLTKRQLHAWKEEEQAHVVLLYTLGGVFTSSGNGVYESHTQKFDSLEAFWLFARDFRSRAVMALT